MDELGAVLLTPQNNEDDLKHKILLTTFELESVEMELEKIKHQSESNQKQLHAQLQFAYEERDEAKIQLQQLLESFMLTSTPQTLEAENINPNPSSMHPVKPHWGITDQSNNVDSFFETVSWTDQNMDYTQQHQQQDEDVDELELNSNVSTRMLGAGQPGQRKVDHPSYVIDQLLNDKVLPQKGRLLEAVMKAGPTLQAVMVVGPLPQWKNPPPVQPIIDNVCGAHQRLIMQSSLSSFMHPPSIRPSPFCSSPRNDGAIFNPNGLSALMDIGRINKIQAVGKRPRLVL